MWSARWSSVTGFWQRRYGGDPGVVGQPITLDGESFTIIGVMPEGFTIRTTELSESRAELWMPFRLVPGDRTGMGGVLNVVARLAPGVTREQAQAELSLVARRIEDEHPSYSRDWGVDVVPLLEATVKDVRLALLVLFGAVGILLLIACANVANLVLSRGAITPDGAPIRLSLGATGDDSCGSSDGEPLPRRARRRARRVRPRGTEFLVSVLPAGLDLPRTRESAWTCESRLFAVFVTSHRDPLRLVPSIRLGSIGTAIGASRGDTRLPGRPQPEPSRKHVIISEVALALILLAVCGPSRRSFRELSRVNPGFRTEGFSPCEPRSPLRGTIRMTASAPSAASSGAHGESAWGSGCRLDHYCL